MLHESERNADLVCRFVGATPASTDLRAPLESPCNEIGCEYSESPVRPMDYEELRAEFARRLGPATAERPLVVFLDALDQLNPVDNAHSLDWLPSDLPEQVRVVVSILDRAGEAGQCLQAARARLPLGHFLEVTPMTPQQGAELLDTWLASVGRSLMPEQRQAVLMGVAQCPRPL